MKYGFVKVAAAISGVQVANPEYNAKQIEKQIKEAAENNASVVVFPELCITGYTCGDLLLQDHLIYSSEEQLGEILASTKDIDIISIVGLPVAHNGSLYNAAAVLYKGKILGVVPKQYLPNYNEFYEQRWFRSGNDVSDLKVTLCNQTVDFATDMVFKAVDFTFAIEICEDLWAPVPVSSRLAQGGAEIIFNLSADNDTVSKYNYLKKLVSTHSAQCICGYVLTSCGFGESTTDTVFGGKSIICENGNIIAEASRFDMEPQITYSEIDTEYIRNGRRTNMTFSATRINTCKEICVGIESKNGKLTRKVNNMPFIPCDKDMDERCEEIFAIQTSGLAKRLVHARCEHVVVGISGGLDSTLALLVCARTFEKLSLPSESIIAITMPGFGTTDRTYRNALSLMQSLGVTIKEISIRDACVGHFKDIGHDINVHDVTYENSQARERTQILMDVANQVNGMVVGTGDLSELALGWATYNGDHMSMYGVNAGIPKTLIKYLVRWVADNHSDQRTKETLIDILDTPISPELIPHDENGKIKQKTEDIVGPYELHDFFLYNFVRNKFTPEKIFFLAQKAFEGIYDEATIKKWIKIFIRRFFIQQFKRSCLPDGPKVGSISLSPRGDWRMPSDASFESWLNNIK